MLGPMKWARRLWPDVSRRHLDLAPFAVALLVLQACQAPSSSPTVITSASTAPAPRSVSVTGTAELRVAPDEFVVSVGVDTYASDAEATKQANDQGMSALIKVVEANKID